MTIFEAMQKTVDKAKATGNLMRLYKCKSGYFISREYWNDWLFEAYPGGRKILSVKGDKIVKSAQQASESSNNGQRRNRRNSLE